MSAEIADNKWELQASKPPVGTFSGILQMILMLLFASLFGYILVSSVIGLVTPKKETSLADQYKNLKAAGAPEAKAPAAE